MNGRIEDLTGITITAESGSKYRLVKQAGCGAQGVVYEESSGKYMVKLYYPSHCQDIEDDVIERLHFIMNIEIPANFVSVVDIINQPYTGYVMEKVCDHQPLNSYLIPDNKIPFCEWYNKGLGLYERLFVGYIIAKAFGELEKSNLSYCDISGNNILVKISKGASVKMIDIDNIYIAGKGKAAVLGTPRYIAPEIIQRKRNPDVLSDNYSLAVILFELLRVGHPYISDKVLDGTPEDEDTALQGNADYVTDDNSTNMLPSKIVLTDKLEALFSRCFVEGKKNRLCRPSAREFENALLEASNKVIKCPSCGAWHYPRKNGRSYEGCPWCDSPSHPNAMLNFYDILLDGDDYQHPNAIVQGDKKPVNTYVLKQNRKNLIKSLYVLRYDDMSKERRTSENYVTIAHNEKGYHVYNEFSRNGVVVKPYGTSRFIAVEKSKPYLLKSGDEIYFEVGEPVTSVSCGGSNYSFIRMARFMEVRS